MFAVSSFAGRKLMYVDKSIHIFVHLRLLLGWVTVCGQVNHLGI